MIAQIGDTYEENPLPISVVRRLALGSKLHANMRLVIFLLAVFCGTAQAQKPPNVSAGEVALLPEYCSDTISFASGGFPEGPLPTQSRWIAVMGSAFWAMHHYCWALIHANRATHAGLSVTQRDHLLSKAIDDCLYVLRNSQPDFVLRPEILLRIGEYLVRLRRDAEALDYFSQAGKIKPDYWPAYARAAEVHIRLGNRQAARKLLQDALQSAPGNNSLTRLLETVSQSEVKQPRREPQASATSGNSRE